MSFSMKTITNITILTTSLSVYMLSISYRVRTSHPLIHINEDFTNKLNRERRVDIDVNSLQHQYNKQHLTLTSSTCLSRTINQQRCSVGMSSGGIAKCMSPRTETSIGALVVASSLQTSAFG